MNLTKVHQNAFLVTGGGFPQKVLSFMLVLISPWKSPCKYINTYHPNLHLILQWSGIHHLIVIKWYSLSITQFIGNLDFNLFSTLLWVSYILHLNLTVFSSFDTIIFALGKDGFIIEHFYIKDNFYHIKQKYFLNWQ